MILSRGRSGKCGRAILAATPLVMGCSYCLANPTFTPGITTGNIQNSTITEASGIAASRMSPNVLWVHDDSGGGNQVVPMTPAGGNLGTYTITGASATDWEDIAVGPGPAAGAQYLYIGDIGDNLAIRSSVAVYRVPEPTVSDTQSPANVSVSGAVRFNFAYPNGRRDAESMFVDPLTRDIYIISKREAETKYVYRAAYPQSSSGTTTMELVASLSNPEWLTAADISPDGSEIIMRSYGVNTGLLYTRPAGGSVADALATTPVSIPLLSETQGEAIGFDPQGYGYYTTTEGATAPIRYFNRVPPPAATVYWDNDGVAAGTYTASGSGMGGSGTWNASALKWYNGSAEVAWLNGNNAVFWGTAGTVTLAAPQSASTLSFKTSGYTVTGSTLTVTGGTINVDAAVAATIASNLSGNITKTGAGTLKLTRLPQGGAVSITGGTVSVLASTPTLPGHPAGSNASLSRPSSLSISPGATLDLANNDLILDYTGPSPAAAIETLVASAYNGTGHWQGDGITSSVAAVDGSYVLAVADNAALAAPFGTAQGGPLFAGVDVDLTTVLIKFTHRADVNLDGVVTPDDASIFGTNYDESITSGFTFAMGDMDYDGACTPNDAAIFGTFYDDSLASLPEPASLGIVGLLILGAGWRERRVTSRPRSARR